MPSNLAVIAKESDNFTTPLSSIQKISYIQNDIKEAYLASTVPWVVAYSGGKDSTLLLQLVCDVLLSLPKDKWLKDVHVVSNDTLVESPLVIRHLDKNLSLLKEFAAKHELPLKIKKTVPDVSNSFWVNIIGRGYIPPTRTFRWCTSKMKIAPTTGYIKQVIGNNKETILLLGVRKSESQTRRRSINKYDKDKVDGRYSPHNDLKGCYVYSPIVDIEDDELWQILLQRPPAWSDSNRDLITLYRNAKGGECPLVMSKDDAPSCGSTSPRFGCWTCTVVNKDKSLLGLVDSGFEEFEPLIDFRDRLIELREDKSKRMEVRRNGRTQFREDGSRTYGPFKLKVRELLLKELVALEQETEMKLISKSEIFLIKRIWEEDAITHGQYG